MKREFASATIIFNDGSAVYWRYLGKFERLYSKEKKYAIQVRVENGSNSLDHFFESWDKPSIQCAEHFIKNAIKNAKKT